MTNDEMQARLSPYFQGEAHRVLFKILSELNDGVAANATEIASLDARVDALENPP